MKANLVNLFIYPIKSLDRVRVEEATILESGALKHDREWAIFDDRGNFVNGKRNAKVHLLRTKFDDRFSLISIQIQGSDRSVTFHIEEERNDLEKWLSDYFGFPVKLVQNAIAGFPDDTKASGPTIISTATINEIASWFQLDAEEIRIRLRANLEIDGVPAFWEDRLFAASQQCVQFKVGEIIFEGIHPCQRCVVPTRDSQTGKATANFQKIFLDRRKNTLPSWTTKDRFNHFYRVSVNTNVPPQQSGNILRIGDEIEIIGVKSN